ncbi:MAG TPA: L-histidine N(alpha)-methyltransferase [Luteimonas sp.]|nr:L-histidine N(alpha)-methyltransferase [Luteimonas sp.]
MNTAAQVREALVDAGPPADDLLGDAIAGMSRTPKRLPSKYFYDTEGSRLFEEITRQPEYYLTRVEQALLDARMEEVASAVQPCVHVVEYGSGSGRKTRQLLEGLRDVVAYTPVEISRSTLLASTARLAAEFPTIEMLPVCADFTRALALPAPARAARSTLMFFPGSTLGNFTRDESVAILRAMRDTMGDGGQALLGVDLDKDPAVIEAAYNDAAGVTSAFTLNLLVRLNRDIGSDFDLAGFRHRAVYARERGRIETFLVSQRAQVVHVGGQAFAFDAGEAMLVEYSHKYTDGGLAELAGAAGLAVVQGWNDDRDWFGLRLLQPA